MSTIRFFTFEAYHARNNIGSTRIRVHNLIKYWDEAELYKYGEPADVLIFQKVYMTYDYKLHKNWPGITILDVCDPDWTNSVDVQIKETFDAVDAIVCPTEEFAEHIRGFTDTQVKVIKDRFDLSEFPEPKKHKDQLKNVVWFGYSHNAETIRFAVRSLESRNYNLIVVSNEDPHAYRWAEKPDEYIKNYTFVKYNHPEAYDEIQKGDVCILPIGTRPTDRFKSENKTVIAELLGLPVVRTSEELEAMVTPESRNKHIDNVYGILKKEYDVNKSVDEYKSLINEIRKNNTKGSL